MRPVGVEFLDAAAKRYVVEREVGAARDEVWDALVDPSTWPRWWPGVRAAAYRSPSPHGVGTLREASVSGQRYREQIVAWDPRRRWAYYISAATLPIAHAQLECTELEDSGTGTRVRWTIANDPRLMMRLAGPFFPGIMGRLFAEAMTNLDAYIRAQPLRVR